VLERFDESAHAVVDRAQREAIALGADRVDAVHLLLALCWADDQGTHQLRLSGLTADGIRGYLAPESAPSVALPPGLPPALSAALAEAIAAGDLAEPRELPFTTQLKMVFHHAQQEMLGRHHPGIDWSHLLLGLLRANPRVRPPRPAAPAAGAAPVVHPAPVADLAEPGKAASAADLAEPAEAGGGTDRLNSLLADLGVNRDTVAMVAITRADTWAAGEGFPYLGPEFPGLPGRRQRWLWHGAVLAGYAVFGAIAIVLAPGFYGRVVAACFLVLGYALVNALTRLTWRARIRSRLARPDVDRLAAPGLSAALGASGVTDLAVVCLPAGDPIAGRSAGRAYRNGRAGTIILRPILRRAHPDLARFIAAHEAAHVARDDSLSYRLAYCGLPTLLGALIGSGALAALWLMIPAFGAVVGLRWLTELACDRIAATATGPTAGAVFAAYLDRTAAALRAKPGYRWRLLGACLTHPPSRLRHRAMTRAPAPPPDPALPG
jgi:Zn-dependent protease with chaperone function